MKKLSLEKFKTTFVENTNSDELEKLTGGILGSCHDSGSSSGGFLGSIKDLMDQFSNPGGKK